ncbi:DUF4391 domain-containing protein [Pueribacillus sp. YX66]|uniref:DUF4391 domain-containing protein n=1 Tax=Pueribacillus sp. YX66 TaxID=3229242 RepID=UPI00358D4AA8
MSHFEFPERTIINRKIPKKTLFSQVGFSPTEKDLFTSEIEGIYLLSIMNEDSMNLQAFYTDEFNYAEVIWIYVRLRRKNQLKKIAETMHKAFPNPSVLVLSLHNQIALSTAHKRVNQNDRTKVVIDEPIITNLFHGKEALTPYNKLLGSITSTKLSVVNVYALYDDLHQWLRCEPLIPLTDTFSTIRETREQIINILDDIHENQDKIHQLKQEQKRQIEFSVQMDLHMEIKKCEKHINEQIHELKGLCN